MKINGRYQRYRGTPRELRSGYGYTRDGLRCVQVRVRYGKIPPAVYPCSTLLSAGHSIDSSKEKTLLCHFCGKLGHFI